MIMANDPESFLGTINMNFKFKILNFALEMIMIYIIIQLWSSCKLTLKGDALPP